MTACTLGSAPGSTLGNDYGKPFYSLLRSYDLLALLFNDGLPRGLSMYVDIYYIRKQALTRGRNDTFSSKDLTTSKIPAAVNYLLAV